MLMADTHDKSIGHRSEINAGVDVTKNFDLKVHFNVIYDPKGQISKSSKYSHVIYHMTGIDEIFLKPFASLPGLLDGLKVLCDKKALSHALIANHSPVLNTISLYQ
jgi:hypothetical protein